MLEKFKEAMDGGNQSGALLTDLSKAFDCTDHKLLIAKLYESGVSLSALNVTSPYLKHRHSQPKLMTVLVLDRKLNTVFHRAQFWVHNFLILI